MARLGRAGDGMAGGERFGWLWSGTLRIGVERCGRRGESWREMAGRDWYGRAMQAGRCMACYVVDRTDEELSGRNGERGVVLYGLACNGASRPCNAGGDRWVVARRGNAR